MFAWDGMFTVYPFTEVSRGGLGLSVSLGRALTAVERSAACRTDPSDRHDRAHLFLHVDRLRRPRTLRSALDAAETRDKNHLDDHLVGLVSPRAAHAARSMVRRTHAGLYVGLGRPTTDAEMLRVLRIAVRISERDRTPR